jgi:PAS domain S-box-containing protein
MVSKTADTIRVLHVDDEPSFGDLVANYLEREDDRLTVQATTHAEDGLTTLAEQDVDCVVSDYDMPGLNGIEFLEAVREEYPELPFILYTGKGSEEVASEAISAGVTDYLQKESGSDQFTILANRIVNAVERCRIERGAEQTRAQLQAISEHSADAIMIIDSDSRIRFANPAVEDHFGYTPSELMGEQLTAIMPERHRADNLDGLDQYAETGEKSLNWSDIEFPGRHKDGSEVPLSISFGEFEQDGSRRFIGVFRDISERVRIEDRLREREERFRQLAENIQEVVWMSDPAKEEMLYVNPTYEDVWGQSTERLYEDPNAFLALVHPADRDRVETAQETQADGEYDETYRIVRPDGELRWVRDRAVPVENDAGEVYRIVGVASDITDQKQQTRRLETLISNLPGIVYRCRNEPTWPMEFVKGEFEAITGYSAERVESGDVIWGEEILHPDDRDRAWEIVQEALDSGEPFECTYRILTKDDTVKWMWERGRVVESEIHDERRLEGFITDITERVDDEQAPEAR